jgi:hypothetical protein
MDIDRSRRLSLDLAVADLAEPEVLTALLAAHVVAPPHERSSGTAFLDLTATRMARSSSDNGSNCLMAA